MPDLQLKAEHRAIIDQLLESIAQDNSGIEFSGVLVGSVARGVDSERSDIDVLLLSPKPLRLVKSDPRAHVQSFTYESFSMKLRSGDDFAGWCVRMGVPISKEQAAWQAIVSSPDASIWPDWRHKITHGARRLILADDMRRIGDIAAASEELLYAAAHIGRAVLLRAGVFPLSRPELVLQLARENPALSEILRRLLLQDEDLRFLNRAMSYLKRLLIHLDKSTFGAFAERRIREVAAKQKPADRLAADRDPCP